MMMTLAISLSNLTEKTSHTFRVFRLHPSVDVQVLESHTVANALEVLVDQGYGDYNPGAHSEAVASRIQHLVP